jgi:hypothetical protein
MFNETEITILLKNKPVEKVVQQLKKDFISKEAPYLALSDHDFFALILLSPEVGIKNADNRISLAEELSLQRKARKYSKGGFFLSKDPVVDALKFLIKKFNVWENEFYSVINQCFHTLLKPDTIALINDAEISFEHKVMHSPYLLIRFISSLFLEKIEDIWNPGTIKKIEYDKIIEIGDKIGLNNYLIFKEFTSKYHLK